MISKWMFDNPHIFNLCRVRLVRTGSVALSPAEVQELSRTLDLWNGVHTSKFTISGKPVMVITCVHPEKDMVDVKIESPLLERCG